MAGTERPTDRDPAEGGDVGPPAAETAEAGSDDDSLVTSQGVNEEDADSPGASLGDSEPAEPNEPG